jgi:hypothetical protein
MDLGQRFPDRQVGSTAEALSIQLVRYAAPIDLTGATVQMIMVDAVNGTPVTLHGTAQGYSNGIVEYQPAAGDFAAPGLYRCQFVVTYPDTRVTRSERIDLRVVANDV